MKKRVVEFFRHNLDEECLAEFSATSRKLFITTGPKTAEFEEEFAEYLGLSHVVGTMSCTHALHLAYIALGIGKGDEVIVPALTFVATVSSVIHAGATPVLVDVHPETGILDPDLCEAAITGKTKAICPVHLYGHMASMDRFSQLAGKHSLKLVEDSAHCIEGSGPGYRPGSMSDAVAFSFYATKNMTCGEGGALGTRHKEVADRVRVLRNHGMNKDAASRFDSKVISYDVEEIGYKANLNDLQSSLLLPQLAKVEQRHARRKEIAEKLNEGLKNIPRIIIPPILEGHKSALHLYTIRVANEGKRDAFLAKLIENGINCSINYRPLSNLTYLREKLGMKPEDFPNANAIGNSTITLPFYPQLEDEEIEYIVETVGKVASETLGN